MAGRSLLLLAACTARPAIVGMEQMSGPTPGSSTAPTGARVELRGRFVKLTDFPCHRSDPYVGGKTVTFVASDGSRTTIVTATADWIGLPARPLEAPLGECRQVRRSRSRSRSRPPTRSRSKDRRLPTVTLAELRGHGMRYTFRLPS